MVLLKIESLKKIVLKIGANRVKGGVATTLWIDQ